tara:strand:- start:175 stop:357 length:183 start_codon:yes stop_codon:yes gene_type:complete
MTVTLDAKLKQLETAVNRQQPVSEFIQVINQAREIVSEVQSYIEREERSAGEVNKTNYNK